MMSSATSCTSRFQGSMTKRASGTTAKHPDGPHRSRCRRRRPHRGRRGGNQNVAGSGRGDQCLGGGERCPPRSNSASRCRPTAKFAGDYRAFRIVARRATLKSSSDVRPPKSSHASTRRRRAQSFKSPDHLGRRDRATRDGPEPRGRRGLSPRRRRASSRGLVGHGTRAARKGLVELDVRRVGAKSPLPALHRRRDLGQPRRSHQRLQRRHRCFRS